MIINGIYVDKRVQKSKTNKIEVISPLMQTDKVVTQLQLSPIQTAKREKKSPLLKKCKRLPPVTETTTKQLYQVKDE